MQTLTLERTPTRDLLLVLFCSFVLCLSGQVSIPLWFTPVPIALQNSTVLLIAALLGSRRGVAATFAFLVQGAMGLPVFSGGTGGFACFLGPRGGYLIGYLVAAFLVGYLVERCRERTLAKTFLAMGAGNLVMYILGSSYLATFVGWDRAFFLGVAPFILGDLLKLFIGVKVIEFLKSSFRIS